MSNGTSDDPEQELADLYLQTASVMRTQFEAWMVLADDAGFAGDPERQLQYEAIAMNAMDISNAARADADLLLWDYD